MNNDHDAERYEDGPKPYWAERNAAYRVPEGAPGTSPENPQAESKAETLARLNADVAAELQAIREQAAHEQELGE